MQEKPIRSWKLVWILLAVAAFWGFLRFQGMGIFGADCLLRYLDSLVIQAGEKSVAEAVRGMWYAAQGQARFQLFFQLIHCGLFYSLPLKWCWPASAVSAGVVLTVLAAGVGRSVGSRACGALVFILLLSGITINGDAHILSLWPIFLWGLGAFGLALWLDRQSALPVVRAVAAFCYFLTPCFGNEALLVLLACLGGARLCFIGLRAALPPLCGGGLFLAGEGFFRWRFPTGYNGNTLYLAEPGRSVQAWFNGTLSGLPCWDFLRLEVVHYRSFNRFILHLLIHPFRFLPLLGFAFLCSFLAYGLARRQEPVSRQEKALLPAMIGGFFLNFVLLACTSKYAFQFTSPFYGYYYTYSFYGYVCASIALALAVRRAAPRFHKGAVILLAAIVFADALCGGLSSQYDLRPIRREVSKWRLWERFVQQADGILPSSGNVHVITPGVWMGVEGDASLQTYFTAYSNLHGEKDRVHPDFPVHALLPLVPGDHYAALFLHEERAFYFFNLTALLYANAAPEWDGRCPVLLQGPLWVWTDSSYAHAPALICTWTLFPSGKKGSARLEPNAGPIRVETGGEFLKNSVFLSAERK